MIKTNSEFGSNTPRWVLVRSIILLGNYRLFRSKVATGIIFRATSSNAKSTHGRQETRISRMMGIITRRRGKCVIRITAHLWPQRGILLKSPTSVSERVDRGMNLTQCWGALIHIFTVSLLRADWPAPACPSACWPTGLWLAAGCPRSPTRTADGGQKKGVLVNHFRHLTRELVLRTWRHGVLNPVTAAKSTCTCCVLTTLSSFSTSLMWLVALAMSARSRSLSASSCSMCCCFSFRASCSAVVPEIFRA